MKLNKLGITGVVLAAGMTVGMGQANAALFGFSYEFYAEEAEVYCGNCDGYDEYEGFIGGVLTGMLEGELQDDGDTVIVSSISDVFFTPTDGEGQLFLEFAAYVEREPGFYQGLVSYEEQGISSVLGGGFGGVIPTVSFSGDNLGISAGQMVCDELINCTGSIFSLSSEIVMFDRGIAREENGYTIEAVQDLVKNNWSLTRKDSNIEPDSVPEPASVLGLLTIAGIGAVTRRRNEAKK